MALTRVETDVTEGFGIGMLYLEEEQTALACC